MSKPLEALEEIKKYSKVVANSEELNIIEKNLKALKIIKEKRVNISTFIAYEPYEDYVSDWNLFPENVRNVMMGEIKLTEEEYNLLKEVLL